MLKSKNFSFLKHCFLTYIGKFGMMFIPPATKSMITIAATALTEAYPVKASVTVKNLA